MTRPPNGSIIGHRPPILIALGANLPAQPGAGLADTLIAAIDRLRQAGVGILARSRWYETSPWPPADQPKYLNAVVAVATALNATSLLKLMQTIEAQMGRVRGARNAPRVLDLDLLTFADEIATQAELTLPHPRLHERLFVLAPMRDVAPAWRHPVTGRSIAQMIDAVDPGQTVTVLDLEAPP